MASGDDDDDDQLWVIMYLGFLFFEWVIVDVVLVHCHKVSPQSSWTSLALEIGADCRDGLENYALDQLLIHKLSATSHYPGLFWKPAKEAMMLWKIAALDLIHPASDKFLDVHKWFIYSVRFAFVRPRALLGGALWVESSWNRPRPLKEKNMSQKNLGGLGEQEDKKMNITCGLLYNFVHFQHQNKTSLFNVQEAVNISISCSVEWHFLRVCVLQILVSEKI